MLLSSTQICWQVDYTSSMVAPILGNENKIKIHFTFAVSSLLWLNPDKPTLELRPGRKPEPKPHPKTSECLLKSTYIVICNAEIKRKLYHKCGLHSHFLKNFRWKIEETFQLHFIYYFFFFWPQYFCELQSLTIKIDIVMLMNNVIILDWKKNYLVKSVCQNKLFQSVSQD